MKGEYKKPERTQASENPEAFEIMNKSSPEVLNKYKCWVMKADETVLVRSKHEITHTEKWNKKISENKAPEKGQGQYQH